MSTQQPSGGRCGTMIIRCRGQLRQFKRFYSEMEKLKNCGFSEGEAKEILERIDFELDKLTGGLATQEHLKKLQSILNDKMASASIFATSTGPFQEKFPTISNSTTNNSLFPSAIDPAILEKEIKTTGQQLTDEIKQLQADFQLDANLEAKRREEVDASLEDKLGAASDYASQRIQHLNEHLDRVSRQAIAAIGGFIGVLTTIFISYSLLSSN